MGPVVQGWLFLLSRFAGHQWSTDNQVTQIGDNVRRQRHIQIRHRKREDISRAALIAKLLIQLGGFRLVDNAQCHFTVIALACQIYPGKKRLWGGQIRGRTGYLNRQPGGRIAIQRQHTPTVTTPGNPLRRPKQKG